MFVRRHLVNELHELAVELCIDFLSICVCVCAFRDQCGCLFVTLDYLSYQTFLNIRIKYPQPASSSSSHVICSTIQRTPSAGCWCRHASHRATARDATPTPTRQAVVTHTTNSFCFSFPGDSRIVQDPRKHNLWIQTKREESES